jgi:hypothetical protein
MGRHEHQPGLRGSDEARVALDALAFVLLGRGLQVHEPRALITLVQRDGLAVLGKSADAVVRRNLGLAD